MKTKKSDAQSESLEEAFTAKMREAEKILEEAGRMICDAKGSAASFNSVNKALEHVGDAILWAYMSLRRR